MKRLGQSIASLALCAMASIAFVPMASAHGYSGSKQMPISVAKVHVKANQTCFDVDLGNVDIHNIHISNSKIKSSSQPVLICNQLQAKDVFFIKQDFIKIGVLKVYIIKK